MNPIRARALRLRLQGHSYNEIHATLDVAKSTLSLWLRDVVLSDNAHKRLAWRVRQGVYNGLIKRNKLQTHEAQKRMITAREEGKKLFPQLTKRDLLLIGVVLYLGEGHKRPLTRGGREITSHSISFVNSDADIVRMFVTFLRNVLGVPSEKIVLYMRLYPHINEQEAKKYWMKSAGLSESSFRKSTFLVSGASKGRRPYNRLPYGTLQVHVADTVQFHRLMGMIEGMKKQF